MTVIEHTSKAPFSPKYKKFKKNSEFLFYFRFFIGTKKRCVLPRCITIPDREEVLLRRAGSRAGCCAWASAQLHAPHCAACDSRFLRRIRPIQRGDRLGRSARWGAVVRGDPVCLTVGCGKAGKRGRTEGEARVGVGRGRCSAVRGSERSVRWRKSPHFIARRRPLLCRPWARRARCGGMGRLCLGIALERRRVARARRTGRSGACDFRHFRGNSP